MQRVCADDINTLKMRQGYSLDAKIFLTRSHIVKWFKYWNGRVYVAFSGGKDSTVLLHLVRELYPEVPAVFVDTGLEYPEVRQFVKTVDNVIWVKPRLKFKEVIEKYGYPVISKKISMGVDRYNTTKSDQQKQLRLYGGINPSSGKKQAPTISKKWHFLVNAPFKCSERCCDFIKKYPFQKYERETGAKPYIGMLAGDSELRRKEYLKKGCLAFEAKKPRANPLAFWLEEDIWEYIWRFKTPYSNIYDMGEDRTGCMFCMFGIHMEKGKNRFQRMKENHPVQYKYCIEKLGCGQVLDYIGIKY